MFPDDGADEGTLDLKPGLGASVSRLWQLAGAVFRGLSAKARFALSLGLIAAVLLVAATLFSRPSATLRVVCRHDFRKADISVFIDGEAVLSETMTGAVVRRWLGVMEKTQGTYTAVLPVGAGKHDVQVRLQAPGYDRTRTLQGDFVRGRESILNVDAGRGLSLAWRTADAGASATEPAGATSGWSQHFGAILLTILGSILSASVGVVVQEFLRARAERAPPPSPRPPS